MKGDRLRCRGCGRYLSTARLVREWSEVLNIDADVEVSSCPTDGCDSHSATFAGVTEEQSGKHSQGGS